MKQSKVLPWLLSHFRWRAGGVGFLPGGGIGPSPSNGAGYEGAQAERAPDSEGKWAKP